MARLRVNGSSCSDRAMVGSALEITVASSVCMNRAQPMISGTSGPVGVSGRRLVHQRLIDSGAAPAGSTGSRRGLRRSVRAGRWRRPAPRALPATGSAAARPASRCADGGRRPAPWRRPRSGSGRRGACRRWPAARRAIQPAASSRLTWALMVGRDICSWSASSDTPMPSCFLTPPSSMASSGDSAERAGPRAAAARTAAAERGAVRRRARRHLARDGTGCGHRRRDPV